MTNSVAELEKTDCIFIIGSNTTSSHPLVATRIYRALKNGAKLIVADPRRIQLSPLADVSVKQKFGTDVALLNGIMHVILENGWHDEAFIEERTEEFDAFREVVKKFTPEYASEICGVPAGDIIRMAELYGKAETASLVYCMGITQHVTGVDNVKSLANLAMLTGNIGRKYTGVNPLRGQNNVQGACDMGGLPNVFTGYQPVTNETARKKMADAWNSDRVPGTLGRTIPAMLDGLMDGEVKALYVLGENPVISDPDTNHVIKALKKAELLVVQDIFLTPTAKLADVVLPGCSFAEKEGTFSNTERRITRVRQAIPPVGESRADWEIIKEVSTRFGYPMTYENPSEIMDEIASVTPSYGGVSHERLEGNGLQWPCPTKEHPGTKILHEGRFTRGRGLFHAVDFRPPAEIVDEEYPFWFTTGRVYAHYHTGTMTRNSPTLHAEVPEAFLEIHPEDAESFGVVKGDFIDVVSRRGRISTKVTVTKRVEKGSLFMPFHFEEACANVLTNSAHDPIAKIPELKVCAVRLEKKAA